MGKHIRTLTIIYDKKIGHNDIVPFRGAVNNKLEGKADLLFHNHLDDEKFRYSYPLIQYKRLRGNAAIVCVEEGTDVIGQFLSENDKTLNISGKELEMNVAKVQPFRMLMQTWNHQFQYSLFRWLPLNAKNYHIFKMLDSDDEKREMLEKILKGNILSMLKGLGIHLEEELIVKITDLSEPYITVNKNVKMSTYNADFTCNLSIPNNVGLGKNASIGFGIVRELKKKETEPIEINQPNIKEE